MTELLSLFKAITLLNLSLAWFFTDVVLLLLIYSFCRPNIKFPDLRALRESSLSQLDFNTCLSIVSILFVILGVGSIAFVSPPNTWDAMTYHMSRVMHWIQNKSLAHYPTSYEPQLYQSPFTELIILNFQILSGGDRFANAVQWSSMIGCVIGTSLIAKQIESSLNSQLLASLIAATVPIGILEASSVKNDYLVSFWLLCIANIILDLKDKDSNKKKIIALSVLLSISLGLALLTKGTANIYALPFIIYAFWRILKKLKGEFWKPLSISVFIATITNLGYYIRNLNLYGSILGPLRESQSSSSSYKNEILNPLTLISNLLRNIGSNLGSPISFLNQKIYGLINKLHLLAGLDINDPRTTFSGEFYVPGGLSTLGFSGNEDNASNTVTCVLILLTIVIFFFSKRLRRNKNLVVYFTLILSSFLLFCLLVKWQIWITRLHLPIFILFSVFAGVVFAKTLGRKQLIGLTIVLMISALPWVTLNRYRPLLGSDNIFQSDRLERYFTRQRNLREPYSEAASFLRTKSCSIIGLDLKGPYEYPIWTSLKAAKIEPLQIQHVHVEDFSSALYLKEEFNTFSPCAIFYLASEEQKDKNLPKSIDYKGVMYDSRWNMGRVSIFIQEGYKL